MFASSPGLSFMDHPVYDVWVLECFNDENAQSPPVVETSEIPETQDTDNTEIENSAINANAEENTEDTSVSDENDDSDTSPNENIPSDAEIPVNTIAQ